MGPISAGGASSPVLDAAASGATASTATALTMLGTALDTQTQMMAQLLKNLQAVQQPGVGGSVNTYA